MFTAIVCTFGYSIGEVTVVTDNSGQLQLTPDHRRLHFPYKVALLLNANRVCLYLSKGACMPDQVFMYGQARELARA
jgi:hypothetical protein